MDEAQITISISPKQMERIAYWIVILGLAILLLLSFLKQDSCTDSTKTTADQEPAAAPVVTPPVNTAPTPTGPTCSDGTKNQGETDIDCGGNACGKCENTKSCAAASDCVSGYCTSGKCADAPTLSGKVTLDIIKEYHTKSNASGTVKVTGIDYKVTNGLDEELDGYTIKVFVKNKAGTRCLNQETSGTCDDLYVEFSRTQNVESGKDSGLQSQQFSELTSPRMGWYLIEDNGYEPNSSLDDYQIFAYLYDSSGNEIGGKVISDTLAVSP